MATSFLTELLKRQVYSISQEITLTEVIENLAKLNIGSLPVVDKDSKLLGTVPRETLFKTHTFLGKIIF